MVGKGNTGFLASRIQHQSPVFLLEDTRNRPPWNNMEVDAVQPYFGQYDPAETQDVPAARLGTD